MRSKGFVLNKDFYIDPDVVKIARSLLGKVLFTNFNCMLTGAIITETEAYNGINDKASHAYSGKKTKRNSIMYEQGGVAYIYLCYGIHSLTNVVTGEEGNPQAVLFRAAEVVEGELNVLKRLDKEQITVNDTKGPGKVSKAMGIHYSDTGLSFTDDKIWIEDHGLDISQREIIITPRIGVGYAGDDASLPYRFVLK